uniref:Transposase, Ptta/En/Spm, plant n=1 Tax=Ananas comosus var. bracteatus TaxID=296719 RepID=A0A6V7NXV9_ANACO|nr:unnamed protein product [Ananas comosus var. bracteatus]
MAALSTLRSITGSAASSSRAPIAASISSVGSALPSSSYDTADSTASEKRHRGVTKNLKWSRKRKRGEKNEIVIDPNLRRAVAGDVVPFVTEMGVVLRQYAVLSNKRRREVSDHIKQKMFDDLVEKFNGIANQKENVFDHLKKMYRDWRHRLHLYYLRFESDENRLRKVPEFVADSDWAYLVEYFGSEEFKRMSARNKRNRAKQGAATIKGRTSFGKIRYAMRDPVSQAEPKMTDHWKATHIKSNGQWMDDRSKKVMVALENIELTQSQRGEPPLKPEEQMVEACGARSGYIRGLGGGPRPTSRKGAELREVYQRQVEELRGALKHQQQEAEEREQRLRQEAEECEHRLRVEAEEREHRLRLEFQAQLQAIMAHIPGLQHRDSTLPTSDVPNTGINTFLSINQMKVKLTILATLNVLRWIRGRCSIYSYQLRLRMLFYLP